MKKVAILIDGCDGAGKSTYAKKLVHTLSKRLEGVRTGHVAFPSPKLKERLRKGQSPDERDFMADFETGLAAISSSYDIVICDRGFLSTAVYQGHGFAKPFEVGVEGEVRAPLRDPKRVREILKRGAAIFYEHFDLLYQIHMEPPSYALCAKRIGDRVEAAGGKTTDLLESEYVRYRAAHGEAFASTLVADNLELISRAYARSLVDLYVEMRGQDKPFVASTLKDGSETFLSLPPQSTRQEDVHMKMLVIRHVGDEEVLVQEVQGEIASSVEGELLWEASVTGARGKTWYVGKYMFSEKESKGLAPGTFLLYKSWRQTDVWGNKRMYVEYVLDP